MTQVFINGKEIELPDDTKVSVTKQVANIGEIGSRQSNFTNQFEVKGTLVNRAIFDNIHKASTGSRVAYQYATATVLENGMPIVQEGVAILESASVNSYKITIYEGLYSILQNIGTGKISDLPMDLVEQWTQGNVAARVLLDEDFNYLMTDWGNTVGLIAGSPPMLTSLFQYMVPWIKREAILRKICEVAGYTVSGKLLTDVPEFLKSFMMAMTDRVPAKAITARMEVSEAASLSNSYIPVDPATAPGSWVDSMLIFDSLTDHYQDIGHPTPLLDTEAAGGTFAGAFTHYTVKARGSYKVTMNLHPFWPGVWPGAAPTYVIRGYILPGVNNPFPLGSPAPTGLFFEFNNNNQAGTFQNPPGVKKDNLYSALSFNGWPGDRVVFKIFATGSGTFDPVQFYDGTFIQIDEVEELPVFTGPFAAFGGTGEGGAHHYKLNDFSPVTMLPDISQVDFLKQIMKQFCVIPIVDEGAKTIQFRLFDEVIDNIPQARDWSDKIQKQSCQTSFHNSGYAQNNRFLYSFENEIDALKYGGNILTGDQTLTKEQNTVVLPFRPPDTIFKDDGTARVPYQKVEVAFPFLTGIDELNARIVLADFDVPSENGEAFKINISESGGANTTHASGFIFPFVDRQDLDMSLDFQKIIGKYYRLINSMLSDYRGGSFLVDLKPSDVVNFDHLIPVYDREEGVYLYITKIPQFLKNSLSKPEFIRI